MAKTPGYRMKSRMIIVLVGMIVFGFCVVLHQLFKLQIIEGDALQMCIRDRACGAAQRAAAVQYADPVRRV